MPRINTEYREDAKKKIIAAALEVAAEKGWDAVTLEAIAQKVGVTKGALYSYFENRDALLHEVICEVLRNVRVGLKVALESTDDIHTTILDLADLFFEQQKRYAAIFYQLQARLPQDPRFREEFSRFFNNNRIFLRDRIARMKAEGKLSQDIDPEAISSTIMAMTMGLRMSTFCLGSDVNEAKKMWMDSVERILGIGPTGKDGR